jgi:hypothetical protein
MNTFTGEMKVDAMARVVTLLVERQSMMRRHMMDMHGLMMPPMMGVAAPHPPAAGPSNGNATADSEPEEMCLPPN